MRTTVTYTDTSGVKYDYKWTTGIPPFKTTYILTWNDGIKEKIEFLADLKTAHYYYGETKTIEGIKSNYVEFKYDTASQEFHHPRDPVKDSSELGMLIMNYSINI